MSVGKEEIKMFDDLALEQKRIYNDSADYGIPYNKKVSDRVKSLINSIKQLGDFKETLTDYHSGMTYTFEGYVFLEQGDQAGCFNGYKLTITYVKSNLNKKGVTAYFNFHSKYETNVKPIGKNPYIRTIKVKVDNSRVMDSTEKAHITITSLDGKSKYTIYKRYLNDKRMLKNKIDTFWKCCGDPMVRFVGEREITAQDLENIIYLNFIPKLGF